MRIARGIFFPVQQFDICCFRSVMKGLLQLGFELRRSFCINYDYTSKPNIISLQVLSHYFIGRLCGVGSHSDAVDLANTRKLFLVPMVELSKRMKPININSIDCEIYQ